MSATQRAPWKDVLPDGTLSDEFLPISVITGRAVSHTRAEADYSLKYGSLRSIPVADDAIPLPPAAQQDPPALYDHEYMAEWAARHSHRLAPRELEVYVAFWVERRSYKQTATRLAMNYHTVRDLVKRIRRKAGVRRNAISNSPS